MDFLGIQEYPGTNITDFIDFGKKPRFKGHVIERFYRHN